MTADDDNNVKAHGGDDNNHEQHNGGGHGAAAHHETPWYQAPVQLQRWGDTQILPHVNWGDLFFDLFYVGAAYNLGNLLRNERTLRGVLYFSTLFLNVTSIWFDKLMFDARFNVGNDLFHRGVEVLQLAALATAIVHINSVAEMSDTKENPDMFVFCLCNLLHELYHIAREFECYFMIKETPEVKPSTLREVTRHILSTVLLIVATAISASDLYGSGEDGEYDKDHSYAGGTTDDHHDDHADHLRLMAATASDYSDSYENDTPVYLLLAAWVSMSLMFFARLGVTVRKENSIPMNVDFVIHRHGEWVMLMLGETVLSLLIVDSADHDNHDYYRSFYSGVLTVIILQYLHFKSQPHNPNDHALRQSKLQGVLNLIIVQIYSGALVALGASYKMLLYEYSDAASSSSSSGHRLMGETDRLLAGGTVCADDEECKSFTAHLFCYTMVIVWLTLDLMSITHKGLREQVKRCKRHKNKERFKITRVFFVLLHILFYFFFAVLGEARQEPEELAFIGLFAAIMQVGLQFLGVKLFPPNPDACMHYRGDGISPILASELRMSAKWPNTTYGNAVHVAVPEMSDPENSSPDE